MVFILVHTTGETWMDVMDLGKLSCSVVFVCVWIQIRSVSQNIHFMYVCVYIYTYKYNVFASFCNYFDSFQWIVDVINFATFFKCSVSLTIFASTMTPWVGMIMDTSRLLICVRLIPQCFLHISILTFNWDLNNRSHTIEIWISTVSMQTIDFDLSMTQQFSPFPVILLILTWYWDFAAFRGITL